VPNPTAGREQHVEPPLDQLGERAPARDRPLDRRRTRAKRRRPAQHRLLRLALVVAGQRERQPRAVAEAPVDRPLADARVGGDGVHRDVLDPVAGTEALERLEHLAAAPRRVGPLVRNGHGARRC
jgi:hypothetical protein